VTDINRMQALMDFADKNGLFSQYKTNGGQSFTSPFGSFQATQFNVPMMEANWAMNASGGERPGAGPDFFGKLGNPPPVPTVSSGDNPYNALVNQYLQPRNAMLNYLRK
jgi:hypothetical protein